MFGGATKRYWMWRCSELFVSARCCAASPDWQKPTLNQVKLLIDYWVQYMHLSCATVFDGAQHCLFLFHLIWTWERRCLHYLAIQHFSNPCPAWWTMITNKYVLGMEKNSFFVFRTELDSFTFSGCGLCSLSITPKFQRILLMISFFFVAKEKNRNKIGERNCDCLVICWKEAQAHYWG